MNKWIRVAAAVIFACSTSPMVVADETSNDADVELTDVDEAAIDDAKMTIRNQYRNHERQQAREQARNGAQSQNKEQARAGERSQAKEQSQVRSQKQLRDRKEKKECDGQKSQIGRASCRERV